MRETLQALLALQQIDRKIFQVEAELKRLPAELARRRGELDAHEARLVELHEQARVLRGEAKEIEDYTTTMRQRQRKLMSESSSRKIDAAMLAAYEHEIRSLKRSIGQAEDDALGKLGAADELEKEAGALEEALVAERATFAELKANVEREVGQAEARHAELSKERESLSSESIPANHLDMYRRLLEIREGEALAELMDGHCQACFVQIPKNLGVRLMKGELVQCPSCDRILYKQVG